MIACLVYLAGYIVGAIVGGYVTVKAIDWWFSRHD